MVLHSRGKVRVLKLRLKDSDTKHFECYLIFWNFTRKGRTEREVCSVGNIQKSIATCIALSQYF